MGTLAVWYARIDVDEIVQLFQQQSSKKQAMRIDRNVAKARTKDSLAAFAKLTHLVDGEPRIAGDPPLIVPVEDLVPPGEGGGLEEFLHGLIRSYRQTLPGDRRRLLERFRYVHAARKVVGVGSVGTRAWIVLMVGRDESDPALPPGQAGRGIGARAVPRQERLLPSRPARRRGSAADPGRERHHAGLAAHHRRRGRRRDFYLRQLWDSKGSAVIETMNPKMMGTYAKVCGWALAKSHARSGDAIAIASYLGNSDALDRALSAFAESYAEQNDLDYQALKTAAASGRVKAEMGV